MLEADYHRARKEIAKQENVTVKWETLSEIITLASFVLPTMKNGVRVSIGDSLRLRHKNLGQTNEWTSVGTVTQLSLGDSDKITIGLPTQKDIPTDQNEGFTVQFVYDGTAFSRMLMAMKDFARNSEDYPVCSDSIRRTILGQESQLDEDEPPADLPGLSVVNDLQEETEIPGLPNLNTSQFDCMKTILQQPFSILQGPPGTGKTVTSASIVYHLASRPFGQVLVCAPSNVAIDHLAAKIAATGVNVVRLASKQQASLDSPGAPWTLHYQVQNYVYTTDDEANAEYQELLYLQREEGLTREEQVIFDAMQESIAFEILGAGYHGMLTFN